MLSRRTPIREGAQGRDARRKASRPAATAETCRPLPTPPYPRPRSALRLAGPASCSVGPVTGTQDLLASAVTDLGDAPLGDPIEAGDDVYAEVMRRISGEPGTTVSAFNSSI